MTAIEKLLRESKELSGRTNYNVTPLQLNHAVMRATYQLALCKDFCGRGPLIYCDERCYDARALLAIYDVVTDDRKDRIIRCLMDALDEIIVRDTKVHMEAGMIDGQFARLARKGTEAANKIAEETK